MNEKQLYTLVKEFAKKTKSIRNSYTRFQTRLAVFRFYAESAIPLEKARK